MKKSMIGLLFFSCSFSLFAETLTDPVVDVTQAKIFGLWRVYNSGSTIYIVDKEKRRFLRMDASSNRPVYYNEERLAFSLFDNGTSKAGNILSETHPWLKDVETAKNIEVSAHLLNGLFGFGEKRFQVDNETLTIYNQSDLDDTTQTLKTQITLKKYSNAVINKGTQTVSNFEESIVIAPSNILVPPRILGDCVTTYSNETQKLIIPCLVINGQTIIYEIQLKQTPDTLNFTADLFSFKRVQ